MLGLCPRIKIIGLQLRSATLRFGFGAGLLCTQVLGCAAVAKKNETLETQDPALQHELAISHLKESDLALRDQTVEAAERAIKLATQALRWAPPEGHAQAWTVSRLLLVRGRASAQLANLEAAVVDYQAALVWAQRDRGQTPLLPVEILLEHSETLARQSKHEDARQLAGEARSRAKRLGKQAIEHHCEALILEGDLATRLGKRGAEAPRNYFKGVFRVAQQYGYPEEIWTHLDRALLRIDPKSSDEAQALMGPVPGLRREARDKKVPAYVKAKSRRAPVQEYDLSSGSVENAGEVVARMRPAFRRCYETGLQVQSGKTGSIRLTMMIGPDGQVSSVTEQHAGVHQEVVDCVTSHARRARFAQPESGQATLVVPATFVKQAER